MPLRREFSVVALVTTVVVMMVASLWTIPSGTAFSLSSTFTIGSSCSSPGTKTQLLLLSPPVGSARLHPSRLERQRRKRSCLYTKGGLNEEDDDEEEEEEDDEDYIDTAILGDWRSFRRTLAMTDDDETSLSSSAKMVRRTVTVSKGNEEVLAAQNEELHQEYKSGVWAHETSTPEVGGLVVRMPLEMELYRNHKHSIMGRRLRKQLEGGETVEMGVWYAKAKRLIEKEMKSIATKADNQGNIDASRLGDECSELLSLFLDNQETWQEVCLVLEQRGGKAKTLVLNRPMAFKLTENLGKLVLNGAFTKKKNDMPSDERRDLMRFMMAFSSECAVYVGGPKDQGEPAIMIHGIKDLPGAVEISPGANIYQGGINGAIDGVLEGKYSALQFRFFVGCHTYVESALDVAIHLGKYQPIACARSLALKQCISLPKPLWHEVLELCGGSMKDLSTLELIKRDDLQAQVFDESDYDDGGVEIEIIDEIGELDNFDDDDDDVLI